MGKWNVVCLICIMVIGIFIYGKVNGGEEDKEGEESSLSEVSGSDVESEVSESPHNLNLLTGITDLSEEGIGKRPVAVMVNNVNDAMPQYGIAEASILYEIPVEGDLTRLMALYADYTKVPQICSIRSCRYYFPAISEGYDAFYVHWGSDQTILAYIEELKLDRFDGMTDTNELFGRDENRLANGYDLEHTAYFDGTRLPQVLVEKGVRIELEEEKSVPVFSFTQEGEVRKYEGESCEEIEVNFGSTISSFIYNTETNTYGKFHNGEAHIDGNSMRQLEFTNIFVLETSIAVRDEVGHKEIDWAGSTSTKGYYISQGMCQEIRWYKEGGVEKGRLIITDVDGEEIEVNSGKSYIGYIPSNF